ncbi:MAG: hypothetical protein K0Q49_245 [Haloplasmataceae bacterium]|nr:hypothetical protein [Haloplasmataceae bacterium]
MKQYLAFDIGGTDIKYGLIDETCHFIFTEVTPTHAYNGGLSIIKKIITLTNQLKEKYKIDGIAISTAGIIDPFKGEVIYATNAIPNYIGVKIKELIEQETGILAEVDNDVNCFAMCEKFIGNASECHNFITLTIGTGVGGAIYLNDQMYYGNDFSAGEWGRMLVFDQTFEEVASITGLINLANKHIGPSNWNGKKIFDLYDQNDVNAKIAVDTFYKHLSTGIINLIYIFNPEKVILGGGVTARGDKFINELLQNVKARIEPKFITTIEIAKFSNGSGMIGALYHFLDMQKNKR